MLRPPRIASASALLWLARLVTVVNATSSSSMVAPFELGMSKPLEQPFEATNMYQVRPTSSSNSNHHLGQHHHHLKVNVSNNCEQDRMSVTLRFSKPFHGVVHAKDKRKRANCLVEGSGTQTYTMQFAYSLSPSDADYCGLQILSQPQQQHQFTTATTPRHNASSSSSMQTLSLVLVVRLHKTMEFSDDRYFLLSCAAE